MLDQETKRKIDTARNILVGKVPDPKAQVEQITTALIYKFMDDMDKESEELGGKAEFFSNGYEKYSWSKLMDKRLSGQERLDLYVQAISTMSKNPHIPQLFRDIFKDAFLPYRDFETLSLFLKEIDGFSYENSENLGDAFEYLLAVLGSQGNAGQFRTPRHIIDFIVEVVDPKKNENILDPACGTAGFLISAYKHIIKHNSSNFQPTKEKAEEKITEGETAAETVLEEKAGYTGDKLSPDEKTKVMKNIAGYDISPDMVKLSLVNLYLHGFSNPVVHEYDTLTSEKRWNESFDVIMANPPFMTPKGGIRPHKRFQVQANRSEVLFVDYILEHLNVHGRAGIIVPEGIIFQNSNAYKQLRKLLIEDGLFAVVSMPPGVFNPYSGVKTSVLFFDNQLATKTDEILFVKVENDGFDLGAQRKKIDDNDLPEVLSILEAWKRGEKKESECAHWVFKGRIAENSAHNLTGERYKESVIRTNQKWPLVELGKVCEVNRKSVEPMKLFGKRDFVYLDISSVENGTGKVNYGNIMNAIKAPSRARRVIQEGDVLLSTVRPNLKAFAYLDGLPDKVLASTGFAVLSAKEKVLPKYVYFLLLSDPLQMQMIERMGKGSYPSINQNDVRKLIIPLPPLDAQKEIVEQIEVKHRAIAHAKEVIKNLERERRYFGQALRKLKDVGWIKLGDICNLEYGYTDKAKDTGEARFVRITDINDSGHIKKTDQKFINLTEDAKRFLLRRDDLLVARTGATYGKTAVFKENYQAVFASYLIRLSFKNGEVLPEYYWLFAQSDDYWRQAKKFMSGGAQQQFNANAIKKIEVPIVSLEIQKQLIADADKEEQIIKANRLLVNLFSSKIEQILSEI